jgi:Flp pilus assembly protein TadB
MVPAFASDFFIMIVIIIMIMIIIIIIMVVMVVVMMMMMIVGGIGICAPIVRMMMKRVPPTIAQDLPSSARARSQL